MIYRCKLCPKLIHSLHFSTPEPFCPLFYFKHMNSIFKSTLHTSSPPSLETFLSLLPTLTMNRDVVRVHHTFMDTPAKLVCQPVPCVKLPSYSLPYSFSICTPVYSLRLSEELTSFFTPPALPHSTTKFLFSFTVQLSHQLPLQLISSPPL